MLDLDFSELEFPVTVDPRIEEATTEIVIRFRFEESMSDLFKSRLSHVWVRWLDKTTYLKLVAASGASKWTNSTLIEFRIYTFGINIKLIEELKNLFREANGVSPLKAVLISIE